jgi:hypothetical protein
METRSKFHTEDSQILGASTQNLVPGILCVPVLDLPQSGHDLFLPNILQFTVHHCRSKVWHTDRVLKPATKDKNDKMYSTCVTAVCTRLYRLIYAFILFCLKRSGRKFYGLPLYNTEIKTAWSYTSIHPHTFMPCCLINRRYFTALHVRIQITELNLHIA